MGAGALQPAPAERNAAEQRDELGENSRHTHVIPLLIARTLSDAMAC
jgi:hypothetical protein